MKPSERDPAGAEARAHPMLFDLPLDPPPPPIEATPSAPSARRQQRSAKAPTEPAAGEERILPLFEATERPPRAAGPRPRRVAPAPPHVQHGPARRRTDAPLGRRLTAGGADLAILAVWTALVGAAAAGLSTAGARFAPLPVVCLGVLFSLVYTVVPIALWRRTAGMAIAGLSCSGEEQGSISVGQGFRRWIGGVLTVAGLGLPAALLWTGRSLGDRLSDSRVEAPSP